jgi:phenylpyruvate tautomerase PptA (4-oxalocrotonate tautomerase family)
MKESQKAEVIRNITKVFTDIGTPAQAVTVIIQETGLNNWGSAGEQH